MHLAAAAHGPEQPGLCHLLPRGAASSHRHFLPSATPHRLPLAPRAALGPWDLPSEDPDTGESLVAALGACFEICPQGPLSLARAI